MSENKKTQAELLKDQLLFKRKNGILKVSEETIVNADNFCEGYKVFLNSAKTERESVAVSIRIAEEKGFVPFNPELTYQPGDAVYYNNRDKALILAVFGKRSIGEGVSISAAHVDAPRLDLKPYPLFEQGDMAFLKTHYYGGIKKYHWLAIPLSLHGIVIKGNGEKVEIRLGEEPGEPQFCITDLLPHLGREQMTKPANSFVEGEKLNVLIGSRPFREESGSELVKLNIMKLINEKYGIVEEDFLCAELELVPAYQTVDIGFDRSLIGGYGHDDRVCSYAALMAALEVREPEYTTVTVLTDKEEVGSDGVTGLRSSYLRYFIEELASMENIPVNRVFSRSKCLSADVSVAYDPAYDAVYETNNTAVINGGTVLTKYTGSGGKYDTNDATAEYASEVRKLLNEGEVLWQTGELGRIDAGGGGTVAKYIGNLDVDTIDLGVPVLSMHSPFEVVSKLDVYMTFRAIEEFYKRQGTQGTIVP